jgi:glycosyltransferase involved in cell wall biosynthesis
MSRPRFHILSSSLAPADAVSTDTLAVLGWLRRHGCQAEAYGETIHPGLRGVVHPLAAYDRHLESTDDVLIYIHSIGWWPGFCLWQRSRNRKLLRYHHVTPGHFLHTYDPPTAELCRSGAVETAWLARSGPELVLATSSFTAADLSRHAGRLLATAIVPPFHAIDALDAVPIDPELDEELRSGVNLLFVGRVYPHKGHRRLLRALARCRERLPAARLFIVGGQCERIGAYVRDLRAEAEALGVTESVHFAGRVTASQLRTYYKRADVFLCLSEHEGFCVPLAEAMYFGVPVVSYGGSAIGPTMGGQHPLAWNAPDPHLAAESVRLMVTDPRARAAVVAYQRDRYARCFSTEAIGRRLGEALGPLLQESNTHEHSRQSRRIPQLA